MRFECANYGTSGHPRHVSILLSFEQTRFDRSCKQGKGIQFIQVNVCAYEIPSCVCHTQASEPTSTHEHPPRTPLNPLEKMRNKIPPQLLQPSPHALFVLGSQQIHSPRKMNI